MDGARLPRRKVAPAQVVGSATVPLWSARCLLDPRLARGYNAANAALKVALGRIARAIFAASGR